MPAPLTVWTWNPSILIGLALFEAAYLSGVVRLRPRTLWDEHVVTRGEIITFSSGVLLIFVALVSPLDYISDKYWFSAHMVQHLILLIAVPPLLLLGTPGWLIAPVLRYRPVLRTMRVLTQPIVATALFNLDLAFWHVPSAYDLTLVSENMHVVEHVLFLITGVILWWPIFSPTPVLPRLSYPLQMLYLFVQSLVPGIIGAIVTFSGTPLYVGYVVAPRLFGISALTDQQIGGVIMKIFGSFALWIVASIRFFQWFNHEERQAEKQVDDYAITPTSSDIRQ